jgi:DNA-binding NarL/FixJ family response regulator
MLNVSGRICLLSATDGGEALVLCKAHNIDTVLVEREMGGSFRVIERLLELRPAPRILLFTSRVDMAMLFEVDRLKLGGILRKEEITPATLHLALSEIALGRRYVPPDILTMWRTYRGQPDAFWKILHEDAIGLLPRFGRGESDRQVAVAIGRPEATVRWRRYDTMARLNLHRSIDFVLWIQSMGFVD